MSSLRLSILAGFFLFAFLPYSSDDERLDSREIEVVYQAKVNLLGKTNINTFACYSPLVDNTMKIKMIGTKRNNQFTFDHPKLKVPVRTLDCGGRVINKDLQQTLNAEEYPYIQIRIESASINTDGKPVGLVKETRVLTCISIGCVERCLDIPVVMTQINNNRYQFCGSLPLAMTDFELIPPKALMGMIKANDEIIVSFDMMISLANETR